jgi:SAM-dependent methyltransferase
MRHKIDSREIGLEIGLIAGKYFLKTEDLHYGYWPDDLPVIFENLRQAQELHSQLIVSHLPKQAHTILDVGCGVGAFARRLLGLGYQVDCVSPSHFLAQHARETLGPDCRIHECIFEDLETERKYDVVMFSESFQYVHLDRALRKTLTLLNDGGALLICDFFKTAAEGNGVLGGGHRLAKFYSRIAALPFQPVTDLDITPQTAPNLTILNDLLQNVAHPIYDLIMSYLDSNYQYVSRFIHWKYKDKDEKIRHKYFSGERNAKNFSIFKSYRLMLYQKNGDK